MEIWLDDDHDGHEISDRMEQQQQHHSILRLYCMFIFMWQSLFRVSDAGVNILFSFISCSLLY